MSAAPEKLCVFCVHFGWGLEMHDYDSDSGLSGGATCNKGYYYERRPDDEVDWRALILTAEKCEEYEQVEVVEPDQKSRIDVGQKVVAPYWRSVDFSQVDWEEGRVAPDRS